MPDSQLPPIPSVPPALPELSEVRTNQTALPLIPTTRLADLPPVPPALPVVPTTSGGSVGQALGVLESATGIGRRGFWLFAGACWATALVSALRPINHLHTLARGDSPSVASHVYLQGLVDALSTSNAMPPVPTMLTGSWLGLTLVIAIAIAPVLMIAAVWQRNLILPVNRVRWLGLVPAIATLIGGFGMHWFSATITLDEHTLQAVFEDAKMAHDLFGGNVPISAWIIGHGGTSSALRVLDDGHLILLHQPVYWVWLVILALSTAVGVCWAIATPFGASLATVFPPMTGARPKISAVPMGLCTGCIVVGMLVAGSLSDGESAIADRKKQLQAMDLALREQAEREDQDRAELEKIRRNHEEAEMTQLMLNRRKEAEALQARDLAVTEERKRAMKQEAEAKLERARADKQAAVAELERAAAAKLEKVAELDKQADTDHKRLISAWTTAKDSITLTHPTTLVAFDQAIVDVDRLEDTAKKAGAVAERADILTRLTSERAALVKAQENRVMTIKAIFKETEYRKLGEATQELHDYLAAGGDRSRIADLAIRLESAYPWATKTGDDEHGTWADLDAGNIAFRLRRVTVGEENAKPVKVLWFAEHEFSAIDYLAIMPNKLAGDIPSTNMPACGLGYAQAKNACEALAFATTLRLRLPTVAEWTHAQSGGPILIIPTDAQLVGMAWYGDNAGNKMHPSEKLLPGRYGLFDMLGNVAEWAEQPNGTPVLIGGSWKSHVWDLNEPQNSEPSLIPVAGFRVVLEP